MIYVLCADPERGIATAGVTQWAGVGEKAQLFLPAYRVHSVATSGPRAAMALYSPKCFDA